MNYLQLYNKVLSREYIQLEEQAASYAYGYEDNGRTLKIYFEWSNGKTDWLNNFDFPCKPYRDMKDKWYVHRGFLRVWKVIEDKLKPIILNPRVDTIIIAGYSHGAAIAGLCHEYCMFNRRDITDSIYGVGYGCPRFFWGKMNESVKKRFNNFRVIRNCKDIVTHVPPAIFGYKHVGDLFHIGKDEKYTPITSHYATSYVESLKKSEIGSTKVDI